MKTYEFRLKYSLPASSNGLEDVVERLGEAGCTDSLVGIGQAGRIAVDFCREAPNAFEAVLGAVKQLKQAIPEARLIEASPDLVGLSEIAELLGCSRQNIRKLMMNNLASFPAPVHESKMMLWHLSAILAWIKEGGRYPVDEQLQEVSNTNMQLNITKEAINLDPSAQEKMLQGF
jgi:predicted DNA-binding transcriptional regulator AlpA